MFDNPIEIYKRINQFSIDNGMKLTVEKPGESHYSMIILEKHLSSPGVCHGGVVAGFMDAVLGSAALSLSFKSMALVSTVEFKINYFKPVFLGDKLIGEGKVDFEGKKLITSTGNIYRMDKEEKTLVAKAIGTFNKYPLEKTNFSKFFKS
ncbi:MAG: PaaI family thioesterase [Flavobacteriales bacterium]